MIRTWTWRQRRSSKLRPSMPRGQRPPWAAGPLSLLLAASLGMTSLVAAPAARAASCEIPAAAGARPTSDGATPVAPAAATASASIIQIEGEARGAATPATLPAATPLAAPTEAPPDPQALLAEDLRGVSDALAACLSAGDAEMVTRLAGERYLGQLFGSSVPLSRDDYLAIAAELEPVPVRIVDVTEVEQSADGRATAVVTQVVGHQLMHGEWTFTQAPSGDRPAGSNGWMLANERPLAVQAPRDAAPITVEIGQGSFTLDEQSVAGPDVVLRGSNSAAEDHEMLVLRFENGFTSADLLAATGPDLPEDVTFIGEAPVRAGHEADLVLVDLAPGDYTIVCLFPNADGVPFLADGMEATFTVE